MAILECVNCNASLSLKHKHCPTCAQRVVLWQVVKTSMEKSKFRLALLVISVLFLLGMTWIIRIKTGARWPMYGMVILAAPFVPWVLQLAYKNAAPIDEEQEMAEKRTKTSPGVDPIKGKVLKGPFQK